MPSDGSQSHDEQPARVVGGPIEASAVGGHATFAYRVRREASIKDLSVHVPACWLEADPDSFESSIAEIVRSRGRSVLEKLLAEGLVPRALWFETDGSYRERERRPRGEQRAVQIE
jgi:hypothetical protein